jgi:Fe-S cluster biogenesis protein NfuA
MNTLEEKVENALNQIRPYLQADGGDVSLLEITKNMTARIEMKGACKSCSMNMMTLKAGIEETILRNVPEIIKVEAMNLESTIQR